MGFITVSYTHLDVYKRQLLGFETLDDFAAFLKEILGIVTLTEKEVLFYVERMMENTSKLATCPFELTREDIEKIYAESIVVE